MASGEKSAAAPRHQRGITSWRCPRCPDTLWLWQELCDLGLFSHQDRARLEARILAQEGAKSSYRQAPESSVHGCPSLRACPWCCTLVTHNKQGCSSVQCPQCQAFFCYRCLHDHYDDGHDDDDDDYDDYSDDLGDPWPWSCPITAQQELP
ncbi:hypothetical protein Y1Q_0015740 [Alligator mississippiensis]|uniref:Uncharacterized protein n=1 Tax=Alligator mississippiensis TaxID=8496 RepID=A0A151N0Z6_ALLMI|nr:hypothetical protein Y1Q_0015740 [Alligator mississippiensis]